MALLEDHVQWIALGLVLILVLGTLLMALRARRRSLAHAMAANAERVAVANRKAVQENAGLRERVSHLEREIQWYRAIGTSSAAPFGSRKPPPPSASRGQGKSRRESFVAPVGKPDRSSNTRTGSGTAFGARSSVWRVCARSW